MEEGGEVRRGPWTLEEDNLLIQYISHHGEGRWNSLAKSAGLRRTGKSCRLRWLNYLKPDIKRGNLTPQEQLMILELHSKFGNRWSKIAHHLPGRTDNEIKNYWRTRVQKQARQLNMESNSQSFVDAIRRFYMPRLVQKIEQSSLSSTPMDYDDHQSSGPSSSSFETPAISPFPPPPGASDQSYMMDLSTSTVNPPSFHSSESLQVLNPVEIPGAGSALSSTNEWCYVDKCNYDMEELPATLAVGQCFNAQMADHSWISSNMADDIWNLDGLW